MENEKTKQIYLKITFTIIEKGENKNTKAEKKI